MATVERTPPDDKAKVQKLAPAWLETMLKTRFFAPCFEHLGMPRNECNMFCVDCSEKSSAFCVFCRDKNHVDHRVIQVRRSSYHEVVRVSEIEDLIDVKGLHTYIINSAKVFFLNERPQPKGIGAAAGKAAASPYFCEVCSRSLLYEFRFCSIGCKLTGINSNTDATFMLDEPEPSSESNLVEFENAGNLFIPAAIPAATTNTDDAEDASSVAKAEIKPKSFRPPHRNRKGIPRRAAFF